MNVLAVLPPEPWIEINILATLRRHYCEELQVFHYPGGMGNLGSPAWRRTRDKLNQDLVERATALKTVGRLDCMFFIVYDDFLRVKTAKQLRALNVPMVNYHIDMVFQWYRIKRTAPYFDVIAVAQMDNAQHLSTYNSNIEWMPMAANADFYAADSGSLAAERQLVSFVGSFNPYRRALLEACVNAEIAPVVFGRGWQGEQDLYRFDWDAYKLLHDLFYYGWDRWRAEGMTSLVGPLTRKGSRHRRFEALSGADLRGPCKDLELPEIFRSSRINLGFSDTGWHAQSGILSSGKLQSRLRDFEVPMSGGFYLAQETPDHRSYYEVGQEIETWSEPAELTDKVKFYLRNPKAADVIRSAGHTRAMRSHTWRHRFERLFGALRAQGHPL